MTAHLHFVQSIEPLQGGGLGRAAWELSDAMRNAGVSSRLVTTSAGTTDHRAGVSEYRRQGPERAFYSPELRNDSKRLVGEADVVHGHGFYVATNWMLGRQTRHQKKPLVYHAHGIFEPWILARSQRKKALAHVLFENANFRHASLWRALTDKEADQIRAQGITAPVVVCPNGIELSQFERVPALRADLQINKNRKELLFLARLHPKKGLPLLVEAWSRLPAKLRQEWRVVVAGPDELSHRGEVESAVARIKAESEWDFVGSLSGDSKLQALARADAFVLPSHSEGFSVAILEAMACSLPVIATHACNFPALSKEGGCWTVPTTVEALTAALTQLLAEDGKARDQRGAAARKLVEQHYTWPRIAAQLADACAKIPRP